MDAVSLDVFTDRTGDGSGRIHATIQLTHYKPCVANELIVQYNSYRIAEDAP
jgi:hypothetical protein